MSGGGLLVAQCDYLGSETEYRDGLYGGLFPATMVGKIKWTCERRADHRVIVQCLGGRYGMRISPGQGIIEAYECPGGHKSRNIINVCRSHLREFNEGPRKAGWSKDKLTSYGQVGGTKANEACPACIAPPVVRPLMLKADDLHAQLSRWEVNGFGMMAPAMRIRAEMDGVAAQIDELRMRGIVHKCPMKMIEVS